MTSDFWARPHRTARKGHKCGLCFRIIDPGEVYLRGYGKYDGEPVSWVECSHCEWMQTTFDIQDDGVYHSEMLYAFEPEDLLGLRALAGFRHRWRTRSGRLWPIP